MSSNNIIGNANKKNKINQELLKDGSKMETLKQPSNNITGNANKAHKATQEFLKKAGPHMETLKQSIKKTSHAWLKAKDMIGDLQNMDQDEAAQFIAYKLKISTDLMLKVLERLKNDPELQRETKKVFCLFGESLKEAMMIITEVIVKMGPPASEAFIEALKALVPVINAAVIASWGTLQEIAFAACPPCAVVYNLVDTGGKLMTQFGVLMSKAGNSAASVSEMGSTGLDVLTQKTPAIEKIINNFGQILEHFANLTDVMTSATDVSSKSTQVKAPNIKYLKTGGGRRIKTRKYLGGDKSLLGMKSLLPERPIPNHPSFNEVISAWGTVGFAPFDILDLQAEANKRNIQLQKDLKWLKEHIPLKNIQDIEYAVGITQKYMNESKKGGKRKKKKRKTKKRTLRKKHRIRKGKKKTRKSKCL